MHAVYQKFGAENTVVTTVFAESLLMLAPWKLWTSPPDIKPALPETEEKVAVLERGLEKKPAHQVQEFGTLHLQCTVVLVDVILKDLLGSTTF